MDLLGEFITHKVFGRGEIVGLENSCVTVRFDSSNESKKFIYPSAFGRFLVIENNQLAKQIQEYKNEISLSITAANEASLAIEKQHKAKSVKKPTRKATQSKKKVL